MVHGHTATQEDNALVHVLTQSVGNAIPTHYSTHTLPVSGNGI